MKKWKDVGREKKVEGRNIAVGEIDTEARVIERREGSKRKISGGLEFI